MSSDTGLDSPPTSCQTDVVDAVDAFKRNHGAEDSLACAFCRGTGYNGFSPCVWRRPRCQGPQVAEVLQPPDVDGAIVQGVVPVGQGSEATSVALSPLCLGGPCGGDALCPHRAVLNGVHRTCDTVDGAPEHLGALSQALGASLWLGSR